MRFSKPGADVTIPDGTPIPEALARITHLGIGAHHDDLEFMAFHGIVAGITGTDGERFGGVTCTDGRGSARTGRFAQFSDEEMREIRREEQREAARVGNYAAMIQLDFPSAELKAHGGRNGLTRDLQQIFLNCSPAVVYTHNLADKHDSHIVVTLAVLEAIRGLPSASRPKTLLGCEVWRDLDWMPDSDKTLLDVSGNDDLADRLNRLFASQIEGGKRYDLAVTGRRSANATFLDSHSTDALTHVTYAMDLSPLIHDETLDPAGFVDSHIERFRRDVGERISKYVE